MNNFFSLLLIICLIYLLPNSNKDKAKKSLIINVKKTIMSNKKYKEDKIICFLARYINSILYKIYVLIKL